MYRFTSLMFAWMLIASGCHCFEISERYGDRVDRFVDRQLVLDRFYREKWDLTRICWGCKIQGNQYCPPVAVYPESKVPAMTQPVEEYSPGVEPGMLEPTPADGQPSAIPPIDAAPLELPAPPPPANGTASAEVKVVPVFIQGDISNLTSEQLRELLLQAQSKVVPASGEEIKPSKKKAPVFTPSGVEPSRRYQWQSAEEN